MFFIVLRQSFFAARPQFLRNVPFVTQALGNPAISLKSAAENSVFKAM